MPPELFRLTSSKFQVPHLAAVGPRFSLVSSNIRVRILWLQSLFRNSNKPLSWSRRPLRFGPRHPPIPVTGNGLRRDKPGTKHKGNTHCTSSGYGFRWPCVIRRMGKAERAHLFSGNPQRLSCRMFWFFGFTSLDGPMETVSAAPDGHGTTFAHPTPPRVIASGGRVSYVGWAKRSVPIFFRATRNVYPAERFGFTIPWAFRFLFLRCVYIGRGRNTPLRQGGRSKRSGSASRIRPRSPGWCGGPRGAWP